MKRKNKQKPLPLDDEVLTASQEEIINDLKRRIQYLTGPKEEIIENNTIKYSTRNMIFVTITPKEEYVEIQCNLPYDRILDMSRKCKVEPYAAQDKTDIVTYDIKTKFDIQYAVSIVQQSFIYRNRLKL